MHARPPAVLAASNHLCWDQRQFRWLCENALFCLIGLARSDSPHCSQPDLVAWQGKALEGFQAAFSLLVGVLNHSHWLSAVWLLSCGLPDHPTATTTSKHTTRTLIPCLGRTRPLRVPELCPIICAESSITLSAECKQFTYKSVSDLPTATMTALRNLHFERAGLLRGSRPCPIICAGFRITFSGRVHADVFHGARQTI